MNDSIRIRWIMPGENLRDAAIVRREVFCREQGYAETVEFDDIDEEAWHVVLYDGEAPVATGRLYPADTPGTLRIGRVAVWKSYRGAGLGAAVVGRLLERARQTGAAQVELDAQCRAMGFYRRFGFQEAGEEHMDGQIPHKKMKMSLK